MKLAMFTLCMLCGLVCLSASVSAKEIIDLQKYVTCGLTECSLEVDINELSLTSEAKNFLKNAKKTDMDLAISQLPKEISGFDYYIQDKEKMIVTAQIEPASSNYWFMEFEEFILDPWFNSSYPYRQNITLYSSNDTTTLNNILLNLTLNTSGLISQGKMEADCDDLILWDNTLDIELNYTMEGCNSPDTTLHTWIVALSHSNLTTISALYGNNATPTHDIGEDICDIGIETWYLSESSLGNIGTLIDKCPNDYDLDGKESDPAYVDNFIHNGTDFDGNDCLTTTTDYGDFALFSVETLIYLDDDTAVDVAILKGNNDVDPSEREWGIFHANYGACNGLLAFFKMSDSCSEGGEVMACSDDIGTGQWSHYVAVRHTDDIQVYTDNNAGSNTACTHNAYKDGDLTLGAMDCGATPTNLLDGQMDNIRIWNKDLTGAEIDIMYNYLFTDGMTSGWSEEEEYVEGEPEPEPDEVLPVSYQLCVDNNTLINNETLIINGLINNTAEYTLCVNGCDNVTRTCSPEPYVQDLMTYVIIILFIGFIIWLVKK